MSWRFSFAASIWQKLERAVVVVVFQLAEKLQAEAVIRSGKEQKERLVLNDGMQSSKEDVGAQNRKNGTGARQEKQVIVIGRALLLENLRNLLRIERVFKRLQEELVALLSGLLDRLLEKLSLLKMLNDQVEQVDVRDAQPRAAARQVLHEKRDGFANLEFVLRQIVKDVEPDLIASALALQHFVGGQAIQNVVEFLGCDIHSRASRQRSTYRSP